MQVIIDGAYRAPREVNFWLGLVLMQIVLGLSLTGYLLPWDQKGYWATRVATNLLGLVPMVGPQLQKLVVGGAEYGHHTLTRFFALHAGVLPGALIFFLVLHVYMFRRHGLTYKLPAAKPGQLFLARPGAARRRGLSGRAGDRAAVYRHEQLHLTTASTWRTHNSVPSWEPRPTHRINTRRRGRSGTSCSCFNCSNTFPASRKSGVRSYCRALSLGSWH